MQPEGELMGQGGAAAKKTRVDKPELCELIVKQVMDKHHGVEREAEEKEEPAEEPVEKSAEEAAEEPTEEAAEAEPATAAAAE